jgi:hypothetical protein
MRLRRVRTALAAGLLLALGATAPARADQADCPASTVFVAGPNECQLSVNVLYSGTVTSGHTLHILNGGQITVAPGDTLNLNITGALLMDIGGVISGNTSAANGVGATLNITASGNIFLAGDGTDGARITSNQSAGSCSGGGKSGNITLISTGGSITTQPGSIISAGDSISAGQSPKCPGGQILIQAQQGDVDIDGWVLSHSTLTGTGATQRPGGGPITIKANCTLTVTDAGLVSSRGLDPGADLVHLEACVVQVFGVVESTGHGHAVPNNPTNHCYYQIPGIPGGNPADDPQNPRLDKDPSSTACVEIWAGTNILIDSATGARRGEVNADIGFAGGTNGRSWIDIFLNGNLTVQDGVNNDHNVPLPGGGNFFSTFAVHANMLRLTNGFGGMVRAWTTGGSVAASGNAFQADATPAGGDGGSVSAQAALNLNFTGGSLFARGDFNAAGGFGVGGALAARAFQGSVTWPSGSGDVRPTGLDVSAASDGTLAITHCTGFTPGATFPTNGGADPGFPSITNTCPGPTAPTLPTYVTLPSSACGETCGITRKRGVKWNDLNGDGIRQGGEPGLPDWEIHLFGTDINGNPVHVHTTTGADGSYEFIVEPGSYTVCETLKTGWTQTFPTSGANCSAHNHSGTPGMWGYSIVLERGDDDSGNDFGNNRPAFNNRKRGVKWNDLNGDGIRQGGEPGLQNWEIHIFDTATSGAVFHEHTLTDANGQYTFSNLSPDTYTVCETIQTGWSQTFPTSGADCSAHGGGFGYQIVIGPTTIDDNNDFGNHRNPGAKSGMKFHDLNNNNQKDGGEPGLQGWEIHLFGTDVDGNAVHQHVLTDINGNYQFTVPPGTYTVCETIQLGWTQTFPTSGADCSGHGGGFGYSIVLDSDEEDTGNDFGNRLPNAATKSGLKWNDLNGDGVRQGGEPPLQGWTIHIFNGDLSVHVHAVTAADGTYQFVVPPGTYTVCETIQAGWTQTFPQAGPGIVSCAGHGGGLGYQVTLTENQIDEGNDFGNFQEPERFALIPTLSEWGMILLTLLLVGIACRRLWRLGRPGLG